MLEQIDHRGKRFTIDDDDGRIDRCLRTDALERQAQRKFRELERTKAVAGPTGGNPDEPAVELDADDGEG